MLQRFINQRLFGFGKHSALDPYTRPDPTRRKRTVDYWFAILAGLCLIAGIFITGSLLRSDDQTQPVVPLAKEAWLVSLRMPTANCETDRPAPLGCPANIQNEDVWKSETRRDSPAFLDRFKTGGGEPFWLALKVPQDQLKLAAKSSASVLVLPRMHGLVQVWMDGVFQTAYDFSQQKQLLQLSIPKNRLIEARDLTVVLGVFPYPHQPAPEAAINDTREGFYTALDADRVSRSAVFFSTSLHLIAVALFLLLAGILWSASAASRTRDYAVGTQLALLIALTSLISVDLSFRVLNVSHYESVYFALLVLEVILLARFTWTILSGSRTTTPLEAFGIGAVVIFSAVLVSPRWIEVTGAKLMTGYVLPMTYLVCAFGLGHRLFKMAKRRSAASRTRIEFLILACVASALTGAAYIYESQGQSGFHVVWSRWLNLIVLFALVRVFIKSNQTKSSLIELSPASKHHKLDKVPELVEGWLLSLEILKFSSDRQVMSTILSHLWTISQLHDGDVVRADDRTLLVIFERDEDGSEDGRVVKALAEMAKCVKDLEQRLPIVFPNRSDSTSILFRASISKGALKPIWQTDSGTSRIPNWIELDSHRSMQSVKDLLLTDLDGALRSHDSSIVVMSSADAETLTEHGAVSSRARIELGTDPNVVAFIASRMVAKATKLAPKVG